MAMRAWDFGDVAAVEPVAQAARPVLRLVEPAPAPKLMPPAWMVAPAFRAEPPFHVEPNFSVHEQQVAYHAAPAAPQSAPYRSIREVPRTGW